MKKLETLGLQVQMTKGKGYRIEGGLELLDKPLIELNLSARNKPLAVKLLILEETDSTNKVIKHLPDSERHRVVCLAERQTEGRGRRGKRWISPFGKNIYLSMGWCFEGGAAALEGLSLAVGVAVCRALQTGDSGIDSQYKDLKLKWPNDILYQGRKLGGILIEVQGDLAGDCHVVIGVGLNHGMVASESEMIDQPWADVNEFSSVSRNALAANLISELAAMILVFETDGFPAFRDEWTGYDAYLNRAVTLHTATTTVHGVCRGIAPGGAILVETYNGVEAFNGGEITLRGKS